MRALILMLMLTVLTPTAWADIDSLRSEAQIAVAAGEVDIATSKLRQILELAPDDGASHYQIAVLLMDNNGDIFDTIQHFERARDLEFQPLGVAYRLSRLFARTDRDNDALDQLEIMAAGGFGSLKLVEDQADYDSIRNEPRFGVALEAIRAARFPCAIDERHSAFDFWIGEWTVTQNGQFAAREKCTDTVLFYSASFDAGYPIRSDLLLGAGFRAGDGSTPFLSSVYIWNRDSRFPPSVRLSAWVDYVSLSLRVRLDI